MEKIQQLSVCISSSWSTQKTLNQMVEHNLFGRLCWQSVDLLQKQKLHVFHKQMGTIDVRYQASAAVLQ
ncbi:hypothetical protein M758_4G205600 [Ceratodon purpureus]|nr:hypothetical protein M758_4G205600 [Ceratodon purpureus]